MRPASSPGSPTPTGAFLPLGCVLNCTLAVDRVAGWFGIDREAVAPSGGVVVLPWFEGSGPRTCPGRTPRSWASPGPAVPARSSWPRTRGSWPACSMRWTGSRRSGAVRHGPESTRPWSSSAGARRVRVAGDGPPAVRSPDPAAGRTELVALGAAVQAASLVTDEDAPAIARRWAAAAAVGDRLLEAQPRDVDLLGRIRRVRERAVEQASARRSRLIVAAPGSERSRARARFVALGLDTATGLIESVARTFEREEHKTRGDSAARHRATERDRPPGESKRDRP